MQLLELLSVSFVLIISQLPAQQVWTVNCDGGPGVDFTDLPHAVAAAAPGDEIWVYRDLLTPGSCPSSWEYTAPVIDKPLRIVGFVVASSSGGPTRVTISGPLIVLNIPAGQRVTLSNIEMYTAGTSLSSIVLADCPGEVLLEDVYHLWTGWPGNYMHIERCANVVIRGGSFRYEGYPLTIIDSNVLLSTTSLRDLTPFCGYSLPTTEAIRVVNSTVTAIGSVIIGADFYCMGGYEARPGVVVESGLLRVGPGTYLSGGTTAFPPATEYGYQLLTPQASINHDWRGTIVRPPPSSPQPGPIMVDIPSTYHAWAVAGEPTGVTAVGPPGGFALLMVGDWAPGQPPGPFGTLAIDPATAVAVDLVPLGATLGDHDWPNLMIPATAPVAHAFALQALTLSPNGTFGLTEPSPLTVGWPHGVVP